MFDLEDIENGGYSLELGASNRMTDKTIIIKFHARIESMALTSL